jgi:hypothetical protein
LLALAVWVELGRVANGMSDVAASFAALESRVAMLEGEVSALVETVGKLPQQVDGIARLAERVHVREMLLTERITELEAGREQPR